MNRATAYVWACTCGKGGVVTVSSNSTAGLASQAVREAADSHLRGDSTGHIMTWGAAVQVVRRSHPLPPLAWTEWEA